MNKDKLKKIVSELEGASKMHASQANRIESMLKFPNPGPFKMKSPLKGKKGLWANIHAKRKRIEGGSGETMRKPGSEGAPREQDLKDSQ